MDTPWRIQLLGRLQATQADRVVNRFRAHKAGDVHVVTSYLTLAECVAVEPGQATVPTEVQENFRRLLNSGQYVNLVQPTPRTAALAQRLRWVHGLVLGGPDVLHFCAAMEVSAIEFITTDDRLRKPKVKAAAETLVNLGVRLSRGSFTLCLPDKYRQGDMLNEKSGN